MAESNGRAEGNGTAPFPAVPTGTNGAPEGRHADGRFATGNRCAAGRGNKFYRRQASLRELVVDELGEDGVRQLVRKLLGQALEGDGAAARTLLAYLVGKPQPAADPDRCDLHEYGLLHERPSKPEVLRAMVDDVNAGLAAAAVRLLEPSGEPSDVLGTITRDRDRKELAAEVRQEQEAKRRRKQ
jgi:hypothetical protein